MYIIFEFFNGPEVGVYTTVYSMINQGWPECVNAHGIEEVEYILNKLSQNRQYDQTWVQIKISAVLNVGCALLKVVAAYKYEKQP